MSPKESEMFEEAAVKATKRKWTVEEKDLFESIDMCMDDVFSRITNHLASSMGTSKGRKKHMLEKAYDKMDKMRKWSKSEVKREMRRMLDEKNGRGN